MKKTLALCILLLLAVGILLVGCSKKEAEVQVDRTPVDIDLSTMSGTMVYSQVYEMMMNPKVYEGKTVRANGTFFVGTNPSKTQFYPAVLIKDATACCAQGLEFVLEGDPKYPEGYPEEQAPIIVRGTFETYDEMGVLFCHLVGTVLE